MLLSTMMNNRTTLPLELEVDIFPLNRLGSDPDSGETGGREGGHFHLLSLLRSCKAGIAMVLPAVVLLLSISSLLSELFRNRQVVALVWQNI